MNRSEFIAKETISPWLHCRKFQSQKVSTWNYLEIKITLLKFPPVQYFVSSLVFFFPLHSTELLCGYFSATFSKSRYRRHNGQALRASSPQKIQPLSPLRNRYNASLSGLWILALIWQKVKSDVPTSCLNTSLSSASLCFPQKYSSSRWWPSM